MLRVATFNIRNGRANDGLQSWPFRRRTTRAAIAALDADVIGLQEVFAFQRRWLMRGLPAYHAVGAGRDADGRGEQCPVLVRTRRAHISEVRTRWFGDTPDVPGSRMPDARFPRIATVCRIDVAGWRTSLQFVNVHLDAHSEERRAASIRQLLTFVDTATPCVVLGDFNTEVARGSLEPLFAAGFRAALPADAGGTNHDFTGGTDGPRIDHIFVNAMLGVHAAQVCSEGRRGRFLPSDHWPAIADLAPC